jgi:cytochrome c biogenesis protein CcmG/thiol:disulfide interchange protein DsbE
MDWNRRGTWHWLAFVLLVLGTGWTVLSRVPPSGSTAADRPAVLAQEGYLAPDFELVTLKGRPLRLDEVKGKVLLINFWATWCPPCRLEMPAMQQVYVQYRDQGFEILAVNLQEQDAQISAFAQEMGMTFPILVDRDGSVSSTYRVTSLPTTFVVDRSGTIRDRIVGGPLAEALIESKILPLLKPQEGE